MKRCPNCDRNLPLTSFGFRDKAHTKVQSYCQKCLNLYWTRWYSREANRRRQIDGATRRHRDAIEQNRLLVRAFKSHPCNDCGQCFPPEVMDFDHLGNKIADISRMVFTHGPEGLKNELEKCELVCANCHRVRTARRRIKAISQDSVGPA